MKQLFVGLQQGNMESENNVNLYTEWSCKRRYKRRELIMITTRLLLRKIDNCNYICTEN